MCPKGARPLAKITRAAVLVLVRKAIKTVKIFYPFVLAVLPLESLAEMIDELSHFQYPEFNQEFLDGKKKEDPSAVSDTRQILTGIVRKFLICRRLVFRKI